VKTGSLTKSPSAVNALATTLFSLASILNNSYFVAGKSEAQLKEFVLSVFEDFSFEDIISTFQTKYPGGKLPKKWLDDLENKNEIGMILG
jgi:hypothetical protein